MKQPHQMPSVVYILVLFYEIKHYDPDRFLSWCLLPMYADSNYTICHREL